MLTKYLLPLNIDKTNKYLLNSLLSFHNIKNQYKIWTIFTSIFLHMNFNELFINAVLLLIYLDNILEYSSIKVWIFNFFLPGFLTNLSLICLF